MAVKPGKSTREQLFEHARQHVERQLQIIEDKTRREVLKRRFEYVTNGIKAYERKKVGEAVTNYTSYLKLLEEYKGVPTGGLSPANFDKTRDIGDLLLLSGI